MSKNIQIRNSTAEFLVFTQQAGESTKENQQLTSLCDWLLPMLMKSQVRAGGSADSSDDLKSSDELLTVLYNFGLKNKLLHRIHIGINN